LAEIERQEMYDVLQISPAAEPEVISAAYRALAKKYHPDRSQAPNAMNHMARLNVAYQTLRGTFPRSAGADSSPDPIAEPIFQPGAERIDVSGTLEEVFQTIARRVSAARQEILDEVVHAGMARDMATNLVTQAIRETFQIQSATPNHTTTRNEAHLEPASSYDEALKVTIARATTARDGVADTLVRDGLQRGAAMELADAAFERIRKGRDTGTARKSRLSSEQVDLSGSLERGMDVVVAKAKIARQMVVDEMAQDGVPVRTAEQLTSTAFERLLKQGHK